MSSHSASGYKPQAWKAAGSAILWMGMVWAALYVLLPPSLILPIGTLAAGLILAMFLMRVGWWTGPRALGTLAAAAIALFGVHLAMAHPSTVGTVAAGSPWPEIDTLLQEQGFSGAVLVAQNDQVLLTRGYGYADRNRRIPNAPRTRYQLGSVSKQFTAMAILILQAQGKLDARDHLCRYMPDCPAAWQEITLEHLLTHSSGLADYFVPCYSDARQARAIIAQARNKPLAFKPGERFSYSNVGYQLLASIIERISGQPYSAFLEANIFGPLDMRDSVYAPEESPGLAVGYTNALLKACPMDLSFEFGDSGIVSTVQDLYRWGQALNTERLIPQSLVTEMFAARVPMPGAVGFAGYGWVIGQQYHHRVFMHGGFIQGFKSLIARYPDDGLTIIMLSNQQNYAVGSVSELVLEKIFATGP